MDMLDTQRRGLQFPPLAIREKPVGHALQSTTPFTAAAPSLDELEALAQTSSALDRAMGCLVGLAVGDSVGHPLEFIPVAPESGKVRSKFNLDAFVTRSEPPPTWSCDSFRGPGGKVTHSARRVQGEIPGYTNACNKFQLAPGQWTDDCSMALCLADSLLKRGGLDGSDARLTFWSWWFLGYNTAFRKEPSRHGSVGLGGNISRSLFSLAAGEAPPPRFEAPTPDAGNGSLMRLAPVALFFAEDEAAAAAAAAESSYTTHPGPIAAEACAFLAHLLCRAMRRGAFHKRLGVDARGFLCEVADEYEATLGATRAGEPGVEELRRVLRSAEPDGGKERCWNWRDAALKIGETMKARGSLYNGYPNTPGYFGSFCLDGLAMAMHSVAMTTSFDAAIAHCVNLLGDADSTGAICGQIAGALYGYGAIHPRFKSDLHKWDDGQIALRAALLVTRPK